MRPGGGRLVFTEGMRDRDARRAAEPPRPKMREQFKTGYRKGRGAASDTVDEDTPDAWPPT